MESARLNLDSSQFNPRQHRRRQRQRQQRRRWLWCQELQQRQRGAENELACLGAFATLKASSKPHLSVLPSAVHHSSSGSLGSSDGDGDSSWCENNFISHATLKLVDSVGSQLASIMHKLNLRHCSTEIDSLDYYNNIKKSFLAGYFIQTARIEQSGYYHTPKSNHLVDRHPSAYLASKSACVIYNDFVLASRNFIRIVLDAHGEFNLMRNAYGSTFIGF